MPIRAMGTKLPTPRPSNPSPVEIDEDAARTMWPNLTDLELEALRKQAQAEKSRFREEHAHLRDRARARLDELAEGYQRGLDGVLRSR
jgi:hypothetical protein